ncbi:hypothetical protein ABT389_35515 [Streptomyces bacillaris]|uniref:hypothetical protein n=1 Tax=Streptomyces bacillaris TaxID=68179 RepID=UPI00334F739F
MVLLYGQTPTRACRLTTAHVIQDDKGVALQLHEIPLRLPPPLDTRSSDSSTSPMITSTP